MEADRFEEQRDDAANIPAGADAGPAAETAPWIDDSAMAPAADGVAFDADAEEVGGARDRRLGVAAVVGVAALFGLMLLWSNFPDEGELQASSIRSDTSDVDKVPPVGMPELVLSRMNIRDTVYTTDSVYLDVNLKRQHVTVQFRSGNSRTFRISSGNPYISEGMATPAGLFTVQNQVPMAISKQFNDARLHHWIGIQGGVGFHGLDGSGYYGHLGVRPSSHGCVRMARHEIAEMYKLVHPGALILVHNGSPARSVAFCEPDDTVGAELIDSAAVYNRSLGKERMRALYEGRYWLEQRPRLVHLARQRVRWGLEAGDARRIPRQQMPRASYMAGAKKHLRLSVRADRSFVDPLRSGIQARLVAELDSLRARERKQITEEQRNVQYGE